MLLFELFCGIKGARQALSSLDIVVTAALDSEIDEFALQVGSLRWPNDTNMGDMQTITGAQVRLIVEEWGPQVDVILLIGGFPCKDTSKLKAFRHNLSGKESGKFALFLRFLEWVRGCACSVPVRYLVENTNMDDEPLRSISAALGCKPFSIEAAPLTSCTRPRLYWMNWEFIGEEGDRIDHFVHKSVLHLKLDPKVRPGLETGWKTHADFKGRFRCITGYRHAAKPPPYAGGACQCLLLSKGAVAFRQLCHPGGPI